MFVLSCLKLHVTQFSMLLVFGGSECTVDNAHARGSLCSSLYVVRPKSHWLAHLVTQCFLCILQGQRAMPLVKEEIIMVYFQI